MRKILLVLAAVLAAMVSCAAPAGAGPDIYDPTRPVYPVQDPYPGIPAPPCTPHGLPCPVIPEPITPAGQHCAFVVWVTHYPCNYVGIEPFPGSNRRDYF